MRRSRAMNPEHVTSEHRRTWGRPGLTNGGREVPPRHHRVVAAAHTGSVCHTGTFASPRSGCAQLGTAATLSDRRRREAAVIENRSNRPAPVVVKGRGGEHAQLGAEARKTTRTRRHCTPRSTCSMASARCQHVGWGATGNPGFGGLLHLTLTCTSVFFPI